MAKTASTENLKNQITNSGAQTAPAVSPYRKIEAYLVKMKPQIEKSLPKTGVTAERLSRLALTAIKQTPKLLEADYESLLGAIMQSASAGLTPNFMGQCYLIPYYDKNAGCHLVRFELGYRGMIEIMTRSGRVLKIVTNVVHERDEFHHAYGLNESLHHVPSDEADPGEITHFYAYAPLDNGQVVYKVLSAKQINHIRDNYSQAYMNGQKYNNPNNPWVKEYEAMGRKTAIKQLFKEMAIGDNETADILNADETVKRTFDGEPEKIIDIQAYEVEQNDDQEPQGTTA